MLSASLATGRAVAGAFAASALFGAAACSKATLTVEIERSEIQQRVSALFPIQREILLSRVTLQNPVVLLKEGSDRIGVNLDAAVAAPLLPPATGQLGVSAKLAYRPADKAFYLVEPTLDRLEIAGLPPEHSERLRAPAGAIATLVLTDLPVYRLAQRDAKERAAEHVLKSVAVRDGKVEATLGLPGGS